MLKQSFLAWSAGIVFSVFAFAQPGPPPQAGPPAHAGAPAHAGPPANVGPPSQAGPPSHAGPPPHAGPPAEAGPPVNAGPPSGGAGPEEQPAAAEAIVHLIHGIPDVPVTVCAGGVVVLPMFSYRETAKLALEAGEYDVAVVPLAADCASEPVLATDEALPLAAGGSYSVVAHLDAEGEPVLSVFENDLTPARPGMARLVVHHTAAAPAVFAKVGRFTESALDIVTHPFANLAEESETPVIAQLRPGNWEVRLFEEVVEETDPLPPPVYGPAPLQLTPHTLCLVYAVGALDAELFLVKIVVPLPLF